jgi:hypothetical protein
VDDEFIDVRGRFAARVLEERVGEGVADRWPEETGLAGIEERPERLESDISVTKGRTPSKSGAWGLVCCQLIQAGIRIPTATADRNVPHDSGRRHDSGGQSVSQHL